MNRNFLFLLKRPFIWICRFRNRCGYGVHSPFAFNLITQIIYEHDFYYSYDELKSQVKIEKKVKPQGWDDASLKINRLLFRMVNRFQPQTIVSIGPASSSNLYLQTAKKTASCYSIDTIDQLSLPSTANIDFLYIHCEDMPRFAEYSFEKLIQQIPAQGVCLIKDIHCSKTMVEVWKKIVQNEKVGITFDLYDLGIIFFDKSRIKQHYKVNF